MEVCGDSPCEANSCCTDGYASASEKHWKRAGHPTRLQLKKKKKIVEIWFLYKCLHTRSMIGSISKLAVFKTEKKMKMKVREGVAYSTRIHVS
jgi:hypothetical protein